MRLFNSPAELRQVLGCHKKWARTLEALEAAPSLAPAVAYSVGDSLTYRRDSAAAFATGQLIGRRRYHLVVAALTEAVSIEVARVADCRPTGDYSDLTDRQEFSGTGERIAIPAAGVLIVDLDETARVLATPNAEAVVLHVTVEGASFHNK